MLTRAQQLEDRAANDGWIADRKFVLDEGKCQRCAHQTQHRLDQRRGGEASGRVDDGDQSLPVRDPNRSRSLFGGGHKPKWDVLNGRGQLGCWLPALQDEHLFVAATGNPEVDQGTFVSGTNPPRMLTERVDAGVCFQANPLVETGVIEGADSSAELGAEGRQQPRAARRAAEACSSV